MGESNFWQKIRDRAYFKYLDRENAHLSGSIEKDWEEAEREEAIEERINEEAFLHSLSHRSDSLSDYILAKSEIMDRLKFLAYHLHESNMNRKPLDNWIEAQKVYLKYF